MAPFGSGRSTVGLALEKPRHPKNIERRWRRVLHLLAVIIGVITVVLCALLFFAVWLMTKSP